MLEAREELQNKYQTMKAKLLMEYKANYQPAMDKFVRTLQEHNTTCNTDCVIKSCMSQNASEECLETCNCTLDGKSQPRHQNFTQRINENYNDQLRRAQNTLRNYKNQSQEMI